MAQTGYTPIQIYHSATAAAVPLAADLLQGELAINVADGKLYYKNASNVVQLLVAAGTGGGTVTSVTGSGGTTGLTLNGGPITSVGTLTIGGTLAIANGGTGQTTANAALNALLPSQATNSGKVLSTDGTNTSWITVSGGGGGTVTGVSATFPATSSGGTAPVIGVAHSGGACTTTTGTGDLVFGTSPTLVTPALGTPVSGNFSTGTFTWPTFNQNTTGTAAGLSATLVATSGGTGLSSYAVGDLLFASTTTALSKLADVATGNALISGGVGVSPSWGKIGLTTHVSGTLPIANGGTGSTSTTYCNLASNVTGTLPIANGGTGSTTKNFIDLTTNQTSAGIKTFAGIATGGATPVTIGTATTNPGATGIQSQAYNFDATTSIYRNLGTIVISNTATGNFGFESNGNFTAPGLITSTGGGGFSALYPNSVVIGAGNTGMASTGTTQIGWQIAGSNVMEVTSAGSTFNVTGTYGTISDSRAKENITPARSYLNDLCKLNVVNYNLKNTTDKLLGFVAQEVEKVMPGLVETTENSNYPEIEDFKAVKTSVLIPMLVQSVQELKAELDAAKAEIVALKAKA